MVSKRKIGKLISEGIVRSVKRILRHLRFLYVLATFLSTNFEDETQKLTF